ncbi:MAG: rhomboid family intramembrane serine protease [Xanthomonadales bacterium]|nr:rhomboid family intramembrane serine protease [Xanthomonadales bacterium]
MQLARPDFSGLNTQQERQRFKQSLRIALLAAGLLWLLTILDQFLNLHIVRLGLYPRQLSGLSGVLFAPLIHSGWAHLLNNTLPLLVGLTTILYIYPQASRRALPLIYFGSSALAWVFARPSYHIGASGFVFGVLAFLFLSGLLRRDARTIAVSLMVWFLYAPMIWGVLPIKEGTSWEMHLAGAITGVIMAILCRKLDAIKLKQYSWEGEDGNDDEVPDWYLEANNAHKKNQSGEE